MKNYYKNAMAGELSIRELTVAMTIIERYAEASGITFRKLLSEYDAQIYARLLGADRHTQPSVINKAIREGREAGEQLWQNYQYTKTQPDVGVAVCFDEAIMRSLGMNPEKAWHDDHAE